MFFTILGYKKGVFLSPLPLPSSPKPKPPKILNQPNFRPRPLPNDAAPALQSRKQRRHSTQSTMGQTQTKSLRKKKMGRGNTVYKKVILKISGLFYFLNFLDSRQPFLNLSSRRTKLRLIIIPDAGSSGRRGPFCWRRPWTQCGTGNSTWNGVHLRRSHRGSGQFYSWKFSSF